MGDAILRLFSDNGDVLAEQQHEWIGSFVHLLDSASAALRQAAAGCLCELLEGHLDSVAAFQGLHWLVRELSAAVMQQRRRSDGMSAAAGHALTWMVLSGGAYLVSPSVAIKALQRLATDEDPVCAAAVIAAGGVSALLEGLCPQQQVEPCATIAPEGPLGALCCLAETEPQGEEARRVMTEAQAVPLLSSLVSRLLVEAAEHGEDPPCGSEAALELAARTLLQLSRGDAHAFVKEFWASGGILLTTKLLQGGRVSLRAAALKLLSLLVSSPRVAQQEAWLCAPVLVSAVRCEDPDLRREAVAVLHELSSEPEGCSEVVANDALPLLVELLAPSQDNRTREACASALRTIASEQATLVVAAGAVPSLVDLLHDSEPVELRREGALALVPLCDLPKARADMHEAGAIGLLVAQLGDTGIGCQESSAKVLHSLAMHEDSKQLIADAGGLQAVAGLLEPADGGLCGAQEAAALVVQSLVYDNPDNSRQLVESGAHHSLLKLLDQAVQQEDLNAQAAAGTALLNLAQMQDDVRGDLIESEGALELMVEVLDAACGQADHISSERAVETAATQEAAAGLIGMLAEDDDACADAIGRTQAIPRFVELLLQNGNEGSKRASAWALRNLATVDDNRVAMLESGAIAALVRLLSEASGRDDQGDDDAQTAAAGALQILATNDQCSISIAAEGGIPSLVNCLREGSDFCKVVAAGALGTLAYNSDNCACIVNEGAIPLLLELLRSEGGAEGQESAAVALYSLAVNEENRCMILDAGAVPLLLAMVTGGSPEAQEAAAQALGALAKSQVCRETIAASGAVPALVQLLGDEHEDAMREEVARALHNLAQDPGSQAQALISSGAVESLVALLQGDIPDGNYDAKRAACQALTVLAPHSGSADALLSAASGLQSMMELLAPPAPVAMRSAVAQMLVGYASNQRIAGVMQEMGAPSSLLAMLSSGTDTSQLWATRALLCLAGSSSGRVALVGLGAVPQLLGTLRPASSDLLQEAVVQLLSELCKTGEDGQHAWVVGEQGLLDMAGVADAGGEASSRAAVKALAELGEDNVACLSPSGVLTAFVGWISRHGAESLHAVGGQAVLVLCRLVSLPGSVAGVIRAGGVGALVSVLRDSGSTGVGVCSETSSLQIAAADAVTVLARAEGGDAAVIASGGVEALVALLGSASDAAGREVRIAALGALDALATCGEGVVRGRVIVAGAVDPLRRLIGNGSAEESRRAAEVLQHLKGEQESAGELPGEDAGGPASRPPPVERARRLSLNDSPGVVEEPREEDSGVS